MKCLMPILLGAYLFTAFTAYAQNTASNTPAFKPEPVQITGTPTTIKNRKLWYQRTKGKNLALGKKVTFSRPPLYRLTKKGNSDTTDLVDGKLSTREDDTIWFDQRAVGWDHPAKAYAITGDIITKKVNILIDLGKNEPVEKVVLRILGGRSQIRLLSPEKLELFVSKNGKDFYQTASMQKLFRGEKSKSDFIHFYYLEENGTAFAYPFELSVKADARYIGITITTDRDFVFLDEIAVMKASNHERARKSFNTSYTTEKRNFYMKGILARPKTGVLVLTSNINTPNFFLIDDMRKTGGVVNKATLEIYLPEKAVILYPPANKTSLKIKGKPYFRWDVPLTNIISNTLTPMIFIRPTSNTIEGMSAFFQVKCEGVEYPRIKAPIKIVSIPVVTPKLKRLQISLTWMLTRYAANWPGFAKAWPVLGFNTVSCFPRCYWGNSVYTKSAEKVFDIARKNGMKIIMNSSPMGIIGKGHRKGDEMFSVTPVKNKNVCPSYQGEYYRKALQRLTKYVRGVNPDFIALDIECFGPGARDASRCARCLKGQKGSGVSMGEYLKRQGTRIMKDIFAAVKKGSKNGKMPTISCYRLVAGNPVFQHVFDFTRCYPDYVDFASPALYCCGRAQDVHDSISKNYKLIRKKAIIPWLSAGCYGEFESYKLEQMILETLLNGGAGILYFRFTNFDNPMDYYYHAKALSEIAPYEDIIVDGKILNLQGENKNLTYSSIKKGSEMLLLVGNYQCDEPATSIKLPFKRVMKIKDLRNNKNIPSQNPLRFSVPRNGIRLLHVSGR